MRLNYALATPQNRVTRRAAEEAKSRAFNVKAILLTVTCVAGFFAFEHFCWTGKATASLKRRLAGWKMRYQLSNEQVQQVRIMEKEFHRRGNPFNPPRHSSEEERAYSEALRNAMSLPSTPAGEPR